MNLFISFIIIMLGAVSITVLVILAQAFMDEKNLKRKLSSWGQDPEWSPGRTESAGQRRIAEHVCAIACRERSTKARENYSVALTYCEDRLRETGFSTCRVPFTYRGMFYRAATPLWKFRLFPYTFGTLKGVNLLAVREPDSAEVRSNDTAENGKRNGEEEATMEPPLLYVAHLDAVVGSPGADDNASSVAVLLRLAENRRQQNLHRTVMILLVDFEEIGLMGSKT